MPSRVSRETKTDLNVFQNGIPQSTDVTNKQDLDQQATDVSEEKSEWGQHRREKVVCASGVDLLLVPGQCVCDIQTRDLQERIWISTNSSLVRSDLEVTDLCYQHIYQLYYQWDGMGWDGMI